MNWTKLQQYQCPKTLCGAPLKEFNQPHFPGFSIHTCTVCDFQISDRKLSSMVVIRHRKLDPPKFIQEMINQKELNDM